MRIFVAPSALAAGELAIRGDEHHYLAHVRRARAGEPLELVDGAGRRAAAIILRIGETETAVRAEAPEAIAPRPPHVRAVVPLIKGDRMDVCVEKLVEVGADELVVWPAARAVVRLEGDRRTARAAKLQALALAAARQSGRAHIPEVRFADGLADAIAAATGARLVLDPASDAGLALGDATDATVISGPEGGFAPAELDELSRAGFTGLGLGPRVLRAETAPVVAVALIRAATKS